MDSRKHITWSQSQVSKENRQKLHNHKSCMVWLTGLSGSGKSTIANIVQTKLYELNMSTYLLDGDNLRHGINKNLGFSSEDRKENIRRTAEIGKLFVDAGIVVLAALISPFEEDRKLARFLFTEDEFIEIYVECSLEECELRDPKGLYKKARLGEIKNFTGIDQIYEPPQSPDLVISTNSKSAEECANELVNYLIERLK
ncbi:adenylyl-sulfate kinase [Cytobacillus sp. FSL W7-1323]|uniref:adenylyl-sulfate kinase n=1 Tax=Cytobacillus TaxID=2675230 RepID=UPI001CD3905A|nr:adenylyl-sulfate kinase [Cytobacillus kochii]MCA1024806.1 adenylyl-sulfate kinase [Cytobacillus kochii]MCM3323711.1 adenylyl-sulfate kinase [Cytobacillus kochii]MCM3346108.1 adenylyl-sulfate kinase [Cytobacillus kochii]MDM5206498.1 adenylyl-sulfate kinase [Cytobacillus kochii]